MRPSRAEERRGKRITTVPTRLKGERKNIGHKQQATSMDGRRYWLTLNGDENGTRPLERELLILGRQAPLVVKPYKKGHILTVPISPCPKDKFVVAREKRAVDGSEMQSCCYD